MTNRKAWYQSKTIIGGAVMALSFITTTFGWDVEEETLTELITAIATVIGLFLVVYGRITATKKVK